MSGQSCHAVIEGIACYLPEAELTNADLSAQFPQWSSDKILKKTGIATRHIADDASYSTDLAVAAAERLIIQQGLDKHAIEFLLVCTQTPEYLLPTTACLVQHALGLPTTVGALDINLGCSGYVYALSLAKGLIVSGQVSNVLLITSDTYSKLLHIEDKGTRTLFGDGATATWLTCCQEADSLGIGDGVFGTDGRGGQHFIAQGSGLRRQTRGSANERASITMNGPEIFNFTLESVPSCLAQLFEKSGYIADDIDLFVFHQANAYILAHLRNKLGIAEDRFFIGLRDMGNTVSSSIPMALSQAVAAGRLRPGMKVLLLGFGVGYSWAATIVQWT